MPSARLEHEAHRLGLRESAFPEAEMCSPQQMQMVGFKPIPIFNPYNLS